MKIGIKVFALLMIFFLSATTSAQDIPANAWKSGNSWYCNDGYRKEGDECIKFRVPENAWFQVLTGIATMVTENKAMNV